MQFPRGLIYKTLCRSDSKNVSSTKSWKWSTPWTISSPWQKSQEKWIFWRIKQSLGNNVCVICVIWHHNDGFTNKQKTRGHLHDVTAANSERVAGTLAAQVKKNDLIRRLRSEERDTAPSWRSGQSTPLDTKTTSVLVMSACGRESEREGHRLGEIHKVHFFEFIICVN